LPVVVLPLVPLEPLDLAFEPDPFPFSAEVFVDFV
jgi:hypothetical protein